MSQGIKSDITIDFINDLAKILRQRLIESGYSMTSDSDVDSICLKYFNVLKRNLLPVPRRVLKAKQFSCSFEFTEGLEIICQKVKSGQSLLPYLNKIHKPQDTDSLLNSWDIYHFHLGTSIEASGYAKRTSSLLFARVTSKYFYMLDVLDHNSWYSKELIQILHENWRESITSFSLPKGCTSSEIASTEKDIKSLRKSNINTIVQVADGTLYLPPGRGETANGVAIDVRTTCDHHYEKIKNLENHVVDNLSEYRDAARENGVELPNKVHFKLQLADRFAYVVEINSSLRYRVCELPLRMLTDS